MKTYKNLTIILCKTINDSKIAMINNSFLEYDNYVKFSFGKCIDGDFIQPYNLHLISDDKKEVGDWVYNESSNEIYQFGTIYVPYEKKIIASTDPILTMNNAWIKSIGFLGLPTISDGVINNFIKYKKDVKKISVEYDDDKLIINKDNTINVKFKLVEDTYSLKELTEIIHQVVNDSHCSVNRITTPNSNNCAKFTDEWINNNLLG